VVINPFGFMKSSFGPFLSNCSKQFHAGFPTLWFYFQNRSKRWRTL